MPKKYLIGVIAAFVVLTGGTYLVAQRVLGSDLVRSALEEQLATRLAQPVHIGTARASLFPRVAVNLHQVSIGNPAAVEIGTLKIVTGLRGLFSRTVDDAEV